ncbi:hypothetical protein [Paraburkholderia aspalathi]|uniref:hypothetical protein n=1 Tax=Paraburkholderia aspalathi TaxID=1324617 RepID=UPI001B231C93|nr:hypothetical protein [Paraburkholderia aspalathi]CAE6827106.1 hypothetical protein R20943_06455 [Paraburkholderia aspalathi]
MLKRHLSAEYRAGSCAAVEFMQSWSDRAEIAPWDMGDQFLSMRAQMPEQQMRGFQDTVFHCLQMALEGNPPILSDDGWLLELEDPEKWKND